MNIWRRYKNWKYNRVHALCLYYEELLRFDIAKLEEEKEASKEIGVRTWKNKDYTMRETTLPDGRKFTVIGDSEAFEEEVKE